MIKSDAKLRYVVSYRLAHVDPTIISKLLSRPYTQDFATASALAKTMLISILDSYFVNDFDDDPSGWSARIKASLPERDGESFLFDNGEQAEAFVPPELKAEFELYVMDVANELQNYRRMSSRELEKNYIDACEEQLRTTEVLAGADWEMWLALPVWTIEEAAALLFGKDPVELYPAAVGVPDWASFAFREKVIFLNRHVEAGILKVPMTPKTVQEWATVHDVDAPARLLVKAEAVVVRADTRPEDSLHHHTLKLFHHSLLYLAVIHHGYDPVAAAKGRADKTSEKSHAPKQISNAVKAAGLEGSDKAIRDHLRKAVEAYKGEYGYAALERLAALRKLPNDKV